MKAISFLSGLAHPLCLLLVFAGAAQAQSQAPSQNQLMAEPALFNRCYSQLTGRPVPRDSALMRQVRAKQITALAACTGLLDSVALDPASGELLPASGKEGAWILNNFYTFHRSWFPTTVVEQIQNYGDENSPATRNIYDSTEPSLAVTRAVFASGAKYSEVMTLATGVTALRTDDPSIRRWSVSSPSRGLVGNDPGMDRNLITFREDNDGDPSHGYVRNSNSTRSHFLTLDKIQTGELRGILPTTKVQMVPNVSLSLLNQVPDLRGSDQPGLNFSFDMNKSFGGGVIGSPIFVMLNFGHGIGQPMNGAAKVPRRWAKTILNTFMCATLPTLRPGDVEAFKQNSQTAPFRNSTSCLQCHSSLDPMGYTARNLVVVNSNVYPTNEGNDPVKVQGRTAMMVASFRAEVPPPATQGEWPWEPAANFHRQPPVGKLYTRLASGELLNKPVSSIAELGQAVADTDDYYQCATKRYFEFLTGISVSLHDRTNPVNADLNRSITKEGVADRKFIEDTAKKFRASQSVKALIKDILTSSYYSNPDFRP